jgi:hypothetical protein
VATHVPFDHNLISLFAPVTKCTCQCYKEGTALMQLISES